MKRTFCSAHVNLPYIIKNLGNFESVGVENYLPLLLQQPFLFPHCKRIDVYKSFLDWTSADSTTSTLYTWPS